MHIQYMILCEFVREGARNKYDILGTFDQLNIPRLPGRLERATIIALAVAQTEDDLGEQEVHFTVVAPGNRTMLEHHGKLLMQPRRGGGWLGSTRFIFNLANMPVEVAGRYRFDLSIGKGSGSHPLDVVEGPPPT